MNGVGMNGPARQHHEAWIRQQPEKVQQLLYSYRGDLVSVIRAKMEGQLMPRGRLVCQAWRELEARLRALIPRLEVGTEAAQVVTEAAEFLQEGLRRADEMEDR